MNKDIFVNFITNHFNHCVAYGEFADELEHADVIPVPKRYDKTNYRPESILNDILKIYEKLIYKQLSKSFDSLLVANQCQFGKGFSSMYCLLVCWKISRK